MDWLTEAKWKPAIAIVSVSDEPSSADPSDTAATAPKLCGQHRKKGEVINAHSWCGPFNGGDETALSTTRCVAGDPAMRTNEGSVVAVQCLSLSLFSPLRASSELSRSPRRPPARCRGRKPRPAASQAQSWPQRAARSRTRPAAPRSAVPSRPRSSVHQTWRSAQASDVAEEGKVQILFT